MRTLVIYASKYGCAEKSAHILAEQLPGETQVVNIATGTVPDIAGFDTIVIGGSIYGGNIQVPIRSFCDKNIDALSTKRLGLFICAANIDQAEPQLKQNFPASLIDTALATGHFGYALNIKKMNLFERAAVKIIMKTSQSCENIHAQNITDFATSLQQQQVKGA